MPDTSAHLPCARPRPFQLILAFALAALFPTAPACFSAPPKLVVIISADQFRGDYLDRFSEHFGEGGFRRFIDDGVVFDDCHFRHALTATGPGHAIISTGAYPETHGIIGNSWLDRKTWKSTYVVEDPDARLVGLHEGVVLEPGSGRSPKNLLVSAIGDEMKIRLGSDARVFGVARKDRAAILMAGRMADSAYWLDGSRFITSTYYRRALPAWVAAFNGEQRVRADFGRVWERLLPREIYEDIQGPDDAAGEAEPHGLGRTFPHKVDGGRRTISNDFYQAHGLTPFENDLVADFAMELIEAEQLGRDEVPDLLCLGFSQIDSVGHAYGPDSHEKMDSILRLDQTMAGFFDYLDEHIGLEHCAVVFTSDHGVAPLPERILQVRTDFPAGRVASDELNEAVAAALDSAYGRLPAGESWFISENFGYHLRPPALEAMGIASHEAARTVRDALATFPFVADAFTREEILAASSDDSGLRAMARRSYFAPGDRDVVFALKPYYITWPDSGTTHGSPHHYDTHVPLAWLVPGVPPERRSERVGVEDLAPTLADILRVPSPASAVGRRLLEVRH